MKYYEYTWAGKKWLTKLQDNDEPKETIKKHFLMEANEIKEITEEEFKKRPQKL